MEDIDANSMESQTKESEDALAEEKFHLNLPKNVDQYTGLKMADVRIANTDWIFMFVVARIHSSINVCTYVSIYNCIMQGIK